MYRARVAHAHGPLGQMLALGAGAVGLSLVAAAALTYAASRRRPRPCLTPEQWEAALTENGRVLNFADLVAAIAHSGLEPRLRARVWPLLLDVYPPDAPPEEQARLHTTLTQAYHQLLATCQALDDALQMGPAAGDGDGAADVSADKAWGGEPGAAAEGGAPQAQPLPQHVLQFAEAHRLIVIDAVRTDFRPATLAPIMGSSSSAAGDGAAAAGGAPLLPAQLHQWMGSWLGGGAGGGAAAGEEGEEGRHEQEGGAEGSEASASGRGPPAPAWVSALAAQVLEQSSHMDGHCRRQAARLVALLSAYAVHDPGTGYCQGMSDLAVPFLALSDDDATAFWCFAALMRKARRGFAIDEAGLFGRLRALSGLVQRVDLTLGHRLRALGVAEEAHFAYRMLVVVLRRDLPLPQVMVLWEMMWADDWLRQRRRAQEAAAAAAAGSADGLWAPDIAVGGGEAPPGAQAAGEQPLDEPGGHGLLLYFIAAAVLQQRRRVLDECYEGDDVLRLFQSVRIDFWDAVAQARALRRQDAQRHQQAAANKAALLQR